MEGHRLWSWRGIALRKYLWLQVSLWDQSLDQSINDLPDHADKVKSQVRLFTDDTTAYLAITKLAESKQLQDFDTLQAWEIDWDMEFNPGKCQVIRVTQSRSPFTTSYTLNGQTLEVVSSAKYQGVDIASDLSWKPHITRITNTANKSLGFLRKSLKAKKTRT